MSESTIKIKIYRRDLFFRTKYDANDNATMRTITSRYSSATARPAGVCNIGRSYPDSKSGFGNLWICSGITNVERTASAKNMQLRRRIIMKYQMWALYLSASSPRKMYGVSAGIRLKAFDGQRRAIEHSLQFRQRSCFTCR